MSRRKLNPRKLKRWMCGLDGNRSALVIFVLILQSLHETTLAQEPQFAQDLARYQKKAALKTIADLNLRNTFRTCSDGGETIKSKLYELQCLDELCQGRRLPAREPFEKISRKRDEANARLKGAIASESVAKLKQGLKNWNQALNDEFKSEEKNPLTDKDDRLLAAFYLSETDCEHLECSPQVRKFSDAYAAKLRSVYRDFKTLFVEDQAEALSRFQKEQEEFKARYPKLAAKVTEDFQFSLTLSRRETAEVINQRRANLLVLASFYGNARHRDELARNLPSLKEAWGQEKLAFDTLTQSADKQVDKCIEKVALKMANLPDAAEGERYQKEVVAPVKKGLCSFLQKNLSEKSSRFLCARVDEMDVVVPTAQGVFEDLQRDFKSELEVWTTPIPQDSNRRRLSSYRVHYPIWLNEGCWSKADAYLKRGLGLGQLTDAFNLKSGQALPSDIAIKSGYAGFLGHEMLHGVVAWMAAREMSSKSREDKVKIDQCLSRKQVGQTLTEETFADLGVVISQAGNEMCLLPREDGEPFLSWDKKGHASKLFRILHTQSYDTKPFPASCQRFLESIGQKDLFKERCARLP